VLVEGINQESLVARFIAESGPGVCDLVVSVSDLKGLARELEAAGMAFDIPLSINDYHLRLRTDDCSRMRFSFVEELRDDRASVVTQGPWLGQDRLSSLPE
jgi:hypothetical protein